MTNVDATPAANATSPVRRGVLVRVVCLLAMAVLLVGTAVWQVGPRPKPADSGFPKSPPPLALPSDTPDSSPLATAAAQLAAGDLDEARAGFVDVVAEDQDGVAGQVGLVLSRWRTTGPQSVERDLRQLTLEYPESALASFHLGLVQVVLGDERAARSTLRTALELGREAADPTSLRMARIADDLLHPEGFRGSMPVLVQVDEVPGSDRGRLGDLLRAVGDDDRTEAVRIGTTLQRSADAMTRVAAIAATFDKDEPDATVQRLEALAAAPATPAPAADRARMLATLAGLWGGELDRADGCRRLEASTRAGIDAGTVRLARPIHEELCTGDSEE